MAEEEETERATEEFYLQQMCSVRVFESPDSLMIGIFNCLCSSNIYGFIIAAGHQELKLIEIASLEKITEDENFNASQPTNNCVSKSVKTSYEITHIGLNSNDTYLGVVFRNGGSLMFGITDVSIFYTQDELKFLSTFKLSGEQDVGLKMMQWHPSATNLIAICLTNGKASLFEADGQAIRVSATWKGNLAINALHWSPKGKYIILGQSDGKLLRCDKTLECKKETPLPDIFDGVPQQVCHLHWMSTFMVGATYKGESSENDPAFVILTSQKDGPTKFQNFGDIYFGFNEERKLAYYTCDVPEWNIIFTGASNSFITVVLGAIEGKWYKWTLKDSGNADLPLNGNKEETFPIGLTVNYNSSLQVRDGELSLPPTPLLMTLSTDGVLSIFHIVNKFPQAKQDLVRRSQIFQPQNVTFKPSIAQIADKQPNLMGMASSKAQEGTVPSLSSTIIEGSVQHGVSAAPSFSKGFNFPKSTTAPVPSFTVESTQKATPFGSGSVPTPNKPIFGGTLFGPNVTMQSPNAPKTATFAGVSSKVPVSVVDKEDSEKKSVLNMASPKTVNSFGSNIFQGSISQNLGVTSQIVKPDFQGNVPGNSFTSVPAVVTSQVPPPQIVPASTMSVTDRQASALQIPGVKQAPNILSSSAAPQITQIVGTGINAETVAKEDQKILKRYTTASGNKMMAPREENFKQNLHDESSRVDREILKLIKAEIGSVSSELMALRASESKLRSQSEKIGTEDDASLLRQDTEDIEKLVNILKNSCKDQNIRVEALKIKMLKCFDHLQEVESLNDKSHDARYISLLKLKPLDSVTELQKKEIRAKFNAVEGLLSDVNEALDVAWERKTMTKDKRKRSLKCNHLHNLYRSMESVNKVTNNLASRVENLYLEAQHKNLVSSDRFFDRSGKKCTPNEQDVSMRSEASQTTLNTSFAGNLTGEKNAKLRNFLLRRTQTPIRRSKYYSTPVRPLGKSDQNVNMESKDVATPLTDTGVRSRSTEQVITAGSRQRISEDLPIAPPNTPSVSRSTGGRNISLSSLREKLENEISVRHDTSKIEKDKNVTTSVGMSFPASPQKPFSVNTKKEIIGAPKVSEASQIRTPKTSMITQVHKESHILKTTSTSCQSTTLIGLGTVAAAVPMTKQAVEGNRIEPSSTTSHNTVGASYEATEPPPNVTVPLFATKDPRILSQAKSQSATKDSMKEQPPVTGDQSPVASSVSSILSLTSPPFASTPLHGNADTKHSLAYKGFTFQGFMEKTTPRSDQPAVVMEKKPEVNGLETKGFTSEQKTMKLLNEENTDDDRVSNTAFTDSKIPTSTNHLTKVDSKPEITTEKKSTEQALGSPKALHSVSKSAIPPSSNSQEDSLPSVSDTRGIFPDLQAFLVASGSDELSKTSELSLGPKPVSASVSGVAASTKETEISTSSAKKPTATSTEPTTTMPTHGLFGGTTETSVASGPTNTESSQPIFGSNVLSTNLFGKAPSSSASRDATDNNMEKPAFGFTMRDNSSVPSSGAISTSETGFSSVLQTTSSQQAPTKGFELFGTKTSSATATTETAAETSKSILSLNTENVPLFKDSSTVNQGNHVVGFANSSSASGTFSAAGGTFGTVAQNPPTHAQAKEEKSGGLFGGFGLGGKPNNPDRNPFGSVPKETSQNQGMTSVELGSDVFSLSKPKVLEQPSLFGAGTTGFSSSLDGVGSTGFGANTTFGGAPDFGGAPTFGGSPAFGGSPTFGGAPAFGGATFGGGPAFGSGASFGSGAGIFGSGATFGSVSTFGSHSPAAAPVFGQSATGSPSFGQLAAQDSGSPFGGASSDVGGGFAGFGGLAQQTPSFGSQSQGGSSFSSWR